MTFEIRLATPDDAPAICAVHVASIEAFGPMGYDQTQVNAWARDRHPDDYDLTDDSSDVLVATDGDDILAFGRLRTDPGTHLAATVDGEVTAVYVHPDVGRQGVGTAMLRVLEGIARQDGLDSLGLWSSLNAKGFYRRHGYRSYTTHEIDFATDVPATVVEMTKPLDPSNE